MDNKTIKHLKELEAESIYVLREVAAQFERPVILFSGGKDSIVITYLAYMGEHFRVFPISNWTEMDVWQYIFLENIPMPSLYFTHEREVFNRDGQWLAALPCIKRKPTEEVVKKLVRCRTIGDITCTGLTESKATTVADIIDEIASTRVTERGGRADDKRSETAMEDRKKAGYF